MKRTCVELREAKRILARKWRQTEAGKRASKRDYMLRVAKSVGLRPEDVGERPIYRPLQPIADCFGYMGSGAYRQSRSAGF